MELYNCIGRAIDVPERSLEPRKTGTQCLNVSPEDKLEYCLDYAEEFIEFACDYVPDIVEEFFSKYDWRAKRWLQDGSVISFGGKKNGNH